MEDKSEEVDREAPDVDRRAVNAMVVEVEDCETSSMAATSERLKGLPNETDVLRHEVAATRAEEEIDESVHCKHCAKRLDTKHDLSLHLAAVHGMGVKKETIDVLSIMS